MKTAISTILILLACSTVQAQQDKPELSDKQIRRQAAQLHRQMYKAFQRKDYAQAAEKCVQAEALDLPDPVRRHFLYNHACALARLGRKQQAMEKLTAAVEAGWQNLSHLQKDPDLDSLRKMKGYKQLIERLGRSAGPDVVQQENGRTVITGRAADGLAYRVLLGPIRKDDPPRRLVVWLHPSGSLANHAAESLAETFWRHDLAVMVFEGKSPAGWSEQDIADIAEAITAAGQAQAIQPDKPLLLGYSAGGQVALSLWRENPTAYGGLVVDAAYPLDIESYQKGKVQLVKLKDGGEYHATPMFVLVGQADGGSRIWKQAQQDWTDARVPLTVHYVPDGKHEWLFKASQIKLLDAWLKTLQRKGQETKPD